MDIIILFLIYYISINFWLIIMMSVDKRRSKRGKWRVTEKKLWWLALSGGALGGWIGMNAFRHKTKHRLFQVGFPVLAILQSCLWVYLAYLFYL